MLPNVIVFTLRFLPPRNLYALSVDRDRAHAKPDHRARRPAPSGEERFRSNDRLTSIPPLLWNQAVRVGVTIGRFIENDIPTLREFTLSASTERGASSARQTTSRRRPCCRGDCECQSVHSPVFTTTVPLRSPLTATERLSSLAAERGGPHHQGRRDSIRSTDKHTSPIREYGGARRRHDR